MHLSSAIAGLVVTLVASTSGMAAPGDLAFHAPQKYRIFQRQGFEPGLSDDPGYAIVPVEWTPRVEPKNATWKGRVVDMSTGKEVVGWSEVNVSTSPERLERFRTKMRVHAGGWYRIEIRAVRGDLVLLEGSTDEVGVGELFIVAGQSYATNCNDVQYRVTDPTERVAVFDQLRNQWQVAHDPQPVADGSDGGSIWPLVGDALVTRLKVPVGFVNVAIGATSTAKWLPPGPIFNRLTLASNSLEDVRAILWQQGESDVIEKTTTAKYVENLLAIRTTLRRMRGVDTPWFLAKSTHHPTVYNDAKGEETIRTAIDELTRLPGFFPGPDTDTLKGENRGDAKSRRHWSGIGQKNAAKMWTDTLAKSIESPRPLRDRLRPWNLRGGPWNTLVMNRESSILLQASEKEPAIARLAFPAQEIISITPANRPNEVWQDDYELSRDGLTIKFPVGKTPVEAIDSNTLFPPKGSPHSYLHRTGFPEQAVLYRPGRWFHDRDIEVTYRLRAAPKAIQVIHGSLPLTAKRLQAGEKLTIGVSGDSISTGLDASDKVKAPPYQPGYVELVTEQLREDFIAPITLHNRSVAGWSVANGVQDLPKLLAEKPNLVIVAYGMNDVGRKNPTWFGEQTKLLIDRVLKADPNTEILLVSPMLGNKEWIHTPREEFAKYRDELIKLTRPGVALADVTAVWEMMSKSKSDLDLTGNGLNHPNDYGHRLYAQTLLRAFPPGK